jgi:cyclic pyranopterin phosphate synthase
MDNKFSHLDNKGNARIVDISKKKKSSRFARAHATVWLSKKILSMIKNDEFKKGNVINVARIAGIMGAKQTSNLVPLCHNISLESSEIDFRFLEEAPCNLKKKLV